MDTQRKELSFKGQNIYIGIDVHLKSWSVTLVSEATQLKKFSQSPDPDALYAHLARNYPEAEYHSVYEAGFCGFWIHYRLIELGIHNIVVNPADVPTTAGEKLRKTDAVDSGKLARSLRAGALKGIYVPESASLEIRSLIRLRGSITKDQTRQKNRIKSHLRHSGRRYRKRGSANNSSAFFRDAVDISLRPAEVDGRGRFGDFEADTIVV